MGLEDLYHGSRLVTMVLEDLSNGLERLVHGFLEDLVHCSRRPCTHGSRRLVHGSRILVPWV